MSAYVVDPYIQKLLMRSPWLAYAVYLYGPLVSYPFTITAADTINNTSGTASTGYHLVVVYERV